MAKNSPTGSDVSDALRKRVDWLDEERLKTTRRLVQLEQRLTAWERELQTRERRVQELETRLSKTSGQIARMDMSDAALAQFKDEIVKLIDQYDQRRVQGDEELEKLRRLEHELTQREIAELLKTVAQLGRLQDEMEHRKAEEERLAKMIGDVQGRERTLAGQVDTWQQALKFLEETEQSNSVSIGESQTSLLENNRRIESLATRLDVTNHGLTKLQATVQELLDSGSDLRQQMKSWADQVRMGEFQRTKRLDQWQATLDAYKEQMEAYAAEWVRFGTQYKEARTAVQAMADWQAQMEKQQREAAELARVEAGQMRTRWDNFLLENDKRWKNDEIDREQRWGNAERRQREVLEQLQELAEGLKELEQEKDTLWRIQNAQTDAMKKWPRLWLEEVEKAIAHNPSSRRQPTLVQVREE
jgi:chromosome segregation ATPase